MIGIPLSCSSRLDLSELSVACRYGDSSGKQIKMMWHNVSRLFLHIYIFGLGNQYQHSWTEIFLGSGCLRSCAGYTPSDAQREASKLKDIRLSEGYSGYAL
jgi:hypothetical protein